MGEVKGPIHAHCAWFGSELACEICNPACYQNHEMNNPNHLQFCGHPDCPLNPERFKKKEPSEEMKKLMAKGYEESSEEDLDLAKEFEGIEPSIDEGNEFCSREEYEDKLRLSKRKSIRYGGKYKSRGKEKKREP